MKMPSLMIGPLQRSAYCLTYIASNGETGRGSSLKPSYWLNVQYMGVETKWDNSIYSSSKLPHTIDAREIFQSSENTEGHKITPDIVSQEDSLHPFLNMRCLLWWNAQLNHSQLALQTNHIYYIDIIVYFIGTSIMNDDNTWIYDLAVLSLTWLMTWICRWHGIILHSVWIRKVTSSHAAATVLFYRM